MPLRIGTPEAGPPRPAAPPPPAGTRPLQALRDALRLGGSKISAGEDIVPAQLTPEETGLALDGLLPPEYATLKAIREDRGLAAAKEAYRAGKTGPFANDYGDPGSMLWAARQARKNPELYRLVKAIQPGDILVDSWNNPEGGIEKFTKGPFSHAVICTSAGPPPEFIEAVGLTGDSRDPSSNRVRRIGLSHQCYDSLTVRIVRPTEGLPEPARQQASARAIAYVEKQLGKPYDFALTSRNINQAFYCSSLAYAAYADPAGAGMKLPIDKSVDRDAFLVSLDAVVAGLDPVDRDALTAIVVARLAGNSYQDPGAIVDVIVDEVLPRSRTTQRLADSPEERARLKAGILEVVHGGGFERVQAAVADLAAREAAGKFKTPVLGFFRRLLANLAVGRAVEADVHALLERSGLARPEALPAALKLLSAVLPHGETLAAAMFGVKDGRTQQIRGFMDKVDWVNAHVLSNWVLQKLGFKLLPGRAQPGVKTDFVSPSDLAWAALPHYDFNVKPGFPLDRQ
ncbi:MAG: hypothetical protein FJZ01_01755 [Candidatus Sericytochromatia bacterium]|nr:hypothetical protein [Candidatus Tanganyikabacteria bacterium]